MKRANNIFFLLSIASIILYGCFLTKAKIAGKYKSNCLINSKSELLLELTPDNHFTYIFAYLDDTIKGNWIRDGDTLVLFSNYFQEAYIKDKYFDIPSNLIPKYQYTDNFNRDIFQIRRNKLYTIENQPSDSKCFLQKVK